MKKLKSIAVCPAVVKAPKFTFEFPNDNSEIVVHISTLDPSGKGVDGCWARIIEGFSGFNGETRAIFAHYGPNINYGGLADYERGLRKMKSVSSRIEALVLGKGNTKPMDYSHPVDCMKVWLLACGVSEVHYLHPAKILTVDEFCDILLTVIPRYT